MCGLNEHTARWAHHRQPRATTKGDPMNYTIPCDGCGQWTPDPIGCQHGRELCADCVSGFSPCRDCVREAGDR